MVVDQDRIAELDREAVPDALVIGDAQLGLLPDLGPLAAAVVGAGQIGLTLSFRAPAPRSLTCFWNSTVPALCSKLSR